MDNMDGGGRTAYKEGRRGRAVDGVHGGLQERDDDRHRRCVGEGFMRVFLSSVSQIKKGVRT